MKEAARSRQPGSESNVVPIAAVAEPQMPDPPEAVEAGELRAALAQFQAGAATRTELKEADRTELNRIDTLSDALQRKLGEVYEQNVPPDLREIDRAVHRYITTTTGRVSLSVSNGVELDAPALESGAIRGHLGEAAGKILAALDDAIEQGRARQRQQAAALARLKASVRYWCADLVVGPILKTWLSIHDNRPDRIGMDHVEKALYIVQYADKQTGGDAVPEPLHGLEWRRWEPHVRQALMPDSKAVA